MFVYLSVTFMISLNATDGSWAKLDLHMLIAGTSRHKTQLIVLLGVFMRYLQ